MQRKRLSRAGRFGGRNGSRYSNYTTKYMQIALEIMYVLGYAQIPTATPFAQSYTTKSPVISKLLPCGGHLADCSNPHLRKTFLHPDVQKRGCTRIEVSLYACTRDDLSTNVAENFIQDALETVSPDGDGLFLVQPPKRQWENLAKVLDRCLVLAERPKGNIFLAWYAHTKTGRVSGISVRPKPAKVEDDSTWERAIQWTIGDFGFRACPTFRIDILAAEKETKYIFYIVYVTFN